MLVFIFVDFEARAVRACESKGRLSDDADFQSYKNNTIPLVVNIINYISSKAE